MSKSADRIVFLDTARSGLMMLVVIVHAGAVYSDGSHWLVVSGDHRAWITTLVDFLGMFDLAGFFVVSGYFTALIAQQHGPGALGWSRQKRLLIPLVTTALFLNLPVSLVLQLTGHLPQTVFSAAYLTDGWIQHLWFLVNIALYTLLLRLAMPRLLPAARQAETRLRWLRRRLPAGSLVYGGLVVIAAAQFALVTACHEAPVLYEKLPFVSSPYTMVHYFLFFALGLALRLSPSLWREFGRPNAALYATVVALVLLGKIADLSPLAGMVISSLRTTLLSYALVQAAFSQFSRFLDRPCALTRALSGSSYSVYLIHHPIVIVLALCLLGVDWPAEIEFPLLLTVCFALAWVIHHKLIAPHRLMRLLFNGTLKTRRPVDIAAVVDDRLAALIPAGSDGAGHRGADGLPARP